MGSSLTQVDCSVVGGTANWLIGSTDVTSSVGLAIVGSSFQDEMLDDDGSCDKSRLVMDMSREVGIIKWSGGGMSDSWCDFFNRPWKINGRIGEERKRRILINVKFREIREHFMLPKDDMARDMKTFKIGSQTFIPFVFDPIPQETTPTRPLSCG